MSSYADILTPEVQQFIKDNYKKDIPSLVLKGSPFTHIELQDLLQQIESKRKAEKSYPTGFRIIGLCIRRRYL